MSDKKIVVTLKEPISDGTKMLHELHFDNVIEGGLGTGIIWFYNADGPPGCPIPIHNILGVAYKKSNT